MFHFHKWSDWSITEKGRVFDKWKETLRGSYIIQERFCQKCGMTKIRTQATCSITNINSYSLKPESLKANPKHDTVRSQ